MTKKIFLSLMAVLGLLLSAHAQEREITGSVKDHAGAGIVGATILVEGTTKGTTSGADGSFSIKAAPDNVLVVSFMGYQSHTIKVGTQTRIDVVLKENTQAIDDVIVVAFGTAKKEAFTGSATVIKSDDIAKSQQSNVAQALAGKVAGVQLTNTSGQPGESPKIRIRGFSSLNSGNDPLWIVDGMPYSGDLNNLNPSDIESMTVLKDAASNSLYGARGSRDNRRQVGRQFARRPGLCVHHQPGTILRTALQCAEKLLCQFGNECRRGPSACQYEFDGQCE